MVRMIVGPTKKETAMRTWQQAAMNQEHKAPEHNLAPSSIPVEETEPTVDLENEDTGDIPETREEGPTKEQLVAKVTELDQRVAAIEAILVQREKASSDSLPPVFATKEEFVASHIAQLIESRVLDSEDATAIEARKELLGREYDGVFCKS